MLVRYSNTKNVFKFICLIFLFLCPVITLGNEIIKIAETENPEATAQNNGRRIIRTSYDRRFVVYQDSLNSKPVIMWVYSDDGIVWSLPSILAYGSYPSLTVAENDWIYAVWILENEKGIGANYLKDNTLSWESENLPIEIMPEGSIYCKFPVVEISTNAVHIVWQSKNESYNTENILYQRYDRILSDTLSSLLVLSSDSCNSKFPSIAGDLEFNSDLLHVFWTDIPLSQNNSLIVYCIINETEGGDDLFISNPILTPFSSKSYPSFSVRNYEGSLQSDIIISCANEDSSGFLTSLILTNPTMIHVYGTDTISTHQKPMPTVDDIYIRSCAIVWQDNNIIYYGQNIDGHFVTLPPIPVSEIERISKNPNVCYKTFRFDVFDVIWTEGDKPPYKIMYRRMKKRQFPLSINEIHNQNEFPKVFQLLQNYPNPFNNSTIIPIYAQKPIKVNITIYDITGNMVRQLYSGKINSGIQKFTWNAKNDFGQSISSGLYFVRVSSHNNISKRKVILVK